MFPRNAFDSIPGNASEAVPTLHVFLDTETLPETDPARRGVKRHHLRLGVACMARREGPRWTREKWTAFFTAEEFWEWFHGLMRKDRPVWLWAHNWGFDLPVIKWAGELERGRFRISEFRPPRVTKTGKEVERKPWRGTIVLRDPPTILQTKHDSGCSVTIIDLLNWLPMSLAKVGELTGQHKFEMPPFQASDEEWLTYCQNDVRTLMAGVSGVMSYVRRHNLGMFRFTLASQSLAAWRHRFRTCKIRPHRIADVTCHERAGYYGGRVDLNYVGTIGVGADGIAAHDAIREERRDRKPNGPLYEYDVQSMYGSVMRDGFFPTALVDWVAEVPPGRDVRPELGIDCCATVALAVSAKRYPVRTEEGIIFPVGRFVTTLAGPELAQALSAGIVLRVFRFSRYSLERSLQAFAEYLLSVRYGPEGKFTELERKLAKLTINSLTGKFGQRQERWQTHHDAAAPEPWTQWMARCADTGKMARYRSVGWTVQEQIEAAEPRWGFPAISGWITSYGRNLLQSLIEAAGPGNVIYTCTDSLVVTSEGRRRLEWAGEVVDNVPGKLRLTGWANEAEFRALNWFRLDSNWKTAGVPGRARLTETGQLVWERFDGLVDGLYSKYPGTVQTTEVGRLPPGTFKRGIVDPLGWVHPHEMDDVDTLPPLRPIRAAGMPLATFPGR